MPSKSPQAKLAWNVSRLADQLKREDKTTCHKKELSLNVFSFP